MFNFIETSNIISDASFSIHTNGNCAFRVYSSTIKRANQRGVKLESGQRVELYIDQEASMVAIRPSEKGVLTLQKYSKPHLQLLFKGAAIIDLPPGRYIEVPAEELTDQNNSPQNEVADDKNYNPDPALDLIFKFEAVKPALTPVTEERAL